jgi:hypothetical protein
VKRDQGEEKENLEEFLRMAQELDEMDDDVTSSEAELLDRVLRALKKGRQLDPKDAARLCEMHAKYLGDPDGDSVDAVSSSEEEESGEDEEDA